MATAYHVFGACIPQVDTGSANAFEVLGVSEEGGTVEEEPLVREIFSDISGPMAPADHQQMGIKCTIRFKLVSPDEAVVTKIVLLSQAASSAGTPGTPGTLMGTNSKKFKLYLPSSSQNPWVFTNCKIAKNGIKEGTEAGSYDLVIDAWRFIAGSASSVSGSSVYSRTAPS